MSNYNVSPEAGSRAEFDPISHVEAIQARNFVNGRLNTDFATLVALRNARFQPEDTDERENFGRKIKAYMNGLYRYQDVVAISRTDRKPPNFPETFLLPNLGNSPVPGLGRMHSVIINRITQFDPYRLLGIDTVQVTSIAEDAHDGSVRRDFLSFALQDMSYPGSMPSIGTDVGYDVREGDRYGEYRPRNINDQETLRDAHGILDVVSILTAELAMDAQTAHSDVVMPE